MDWMENPVREENVEQWEFQENPDYPDPKDLVAALVFAEKLKDLRARQDLKVLLENLDSPDQKELLETTEDQVQLGHPALPENPDLVETLEALDPEDLQATTVSPEIAASVLCQELSQDTNHSRSQMVHSKITFSVNKDT